MGIVCDLVNAYVPKIGSLLAQFDAWTSGGWSTNLYVTPPGSKGFTTHNDFNDGFIMIAGGAKRWTLYNSTSICPSHSMTRGRPSEPPVNEELGPVIFNATIEEGDVLLVPRGMYHHAQTGPTEGSLHYTISPLPSPGWLDWRHFLRTLSDAVMRTKQWAKGAKGFKDQKQRAGFGQLFLRALGDAEEQDFGIDWEEGFVRKSLPGPDYFSDSGIEQLISMVDHKLDLLYNIMEDPDTIAMRSGPDKKVNTAAGWKLFSEIFKADPDDIVRKALTDPRLYDYIYQYGNHSIHAQTKVNIESVMLDMRKLDKAKRQWSHIDDNTLIVRTGIAAVVLGAGSDLPTSPPEDDNLIGGESEFSFAAYDGSYIPTGHVLVNAIGMPAEGPVAERFENYKPFFTIGEQFEGAARIITDMEEGDEMRLGDLPVNGSANDPFSRICLYREMESRGLVTTQRGALIAEYSESLCSNNVCFIQNKKFSSSDKVVVIPSDLRPSIGQCYDADSLAMWVIDLQKELGPRKETLPDNTFSVLEEYRAASITHTEL